MNLSEVFFPFSELRALKLRPYLPEVQKMRGKHRRWAGANTPILNLRCSKCSPPEVRNLLSSRDVQDVHRFADVFCPWVLYECS